MTINIQAPQMEADLKPRIVVVGVGGAGGNAVNNMIRSNLEGVEFVVANTDAQALKQSDADRKIQLGTQATKGLGAGARPDVGREAALESLDETLDHLQGSNMVFFTAGMGGGTGTGAAPVLAEAAREAGMLTVGVVTKPFHFEGVHRMKAAEQGIEELQQFVDTLIIIPNQNLFRVANEKTTFADAFKMADDVLYSGVRGVTDLMVMPGLINLDFADIRTVMSEMGKAMMGTGEAEGDNRAIVAAESAISNPLLEDVSMKGAQGVLINITGGADMTLFEVDEAANRIREEVDSDANIIFGSTFDESLEGVMRVSVVATGIESEAYLQAPRRPVGVTPLRSREEIPAEPEATEETPEEIVAGHGEVMPEVAEDIDPAGSIETPEEPVANAVAEAEVEAEEAASAEPAEAELFPAEEFGESRPMETAEAPETAKKDEKPEGAPEPVRPRDAYIPPKPARPEEMHRDAGRGADAFAEAAMENGGRSNEPAAKGKPSLFSRMTGLGLGARENGGAEQRSAKPNEPTLLKRPDGRTPQEAVQAEKTATSESAPASQATAQAKSEVEDLAPTRAEDEMLEIPAFLRRQAN